MFTKIFKRNNIFKLYLGLNVFNNNNAANNNNLDKLLNEQLKNLDPKNLIANAMKEAKTPIELLVDIILNFFLDENANFKNTELGKEIKEAIVNQLIECTVDEKNQELSNNLRNISFKDLLQAVVIGFPSKGPQRPAKQSNKNGRTVYYQEYIQDDTKPLVVWFHGNGCDYESYDWGDNSIKNELKNVIAFEYPNYVNNTWGNFEEIDNYTTGIADFLYEDYICNDKKDIILFSHSFGGNVNTLVYSKLTKKIKEGNKNDVNLKAVLVFPYHSAITASATVLLNGKKIIGREDNSGEKCEENVFKKIFENEQYKNALNMVGLKKESFINDVVQSIYKRVFGNGYKDDFQTNLEYFTTISDNAFILKKADTDFLDKTLLLKLDLEHCKWEYKSKLNIKIPDYEKTIKLKELLTSLEHYKTPSRNIDIVLISSNEDSVVGNGGFTIVQYFVDKYQQTEGKDKKSTNLYANNYELLKKEYHKLGYDIVKRDIDFIKNEFPNISSYDFSFNEGLKQRSVCGSYQRTMDYESMRKKENDLGLNNDPIISGE